jgi:hypothetical protein
MRYWPVTLDVMTINLTSIRQSIKARTEAAAQRRALEIDLAAYRTPEDIRDLLAAADRSTDPSADLVRTILSDNLASYYRRVA